MRRIATNVGLVLALLVSTLVLMAPTAAADVNNGHCAYGGYAHDWNTGHGNLSYQGHTGSRCYARFVTQCKKGVSYWPYVVYSNWYKDYSDGLGGGANTVHINCPSGQSYHTDWHAYVYYEP